MVAVRMVSEGVDVPRLCVGVYATSTSTPLFFAQAVGRFVRPGRRGETASVFLPSVPVIAIGALCLFPWLSCVLLRITGTEGRKTDAVSPRRARTKRPTAWAKNNGVDVDVA